MLPLNDQQVIQSIQQLDQQMAVLDNTRKTYFHHIQKLVYNSHQGIYNISAHIYGSVAVGLSLQSSDMDIGITGLPLYTREDVEQEMLRLAKLCESDRLVAKAEAIVKARVPVLKLKMNESNIKIDITLGTHSWNSSVSRGICSKDLVINILSCHKYCREVVLVLKELLCQKGLNEPYTGGLSSYGLVLLAATFIREHVYVESISGMIRMMLQFYSGMFDYKNVGISPMLTYFELPATSDCLVVIDPACPENNVTECTYRFEDIRAYWSSLLKENLVVDRLNL